jgi:hypothetical protein
MKSPHELDRTIRLVRESVQEDITDEEIVRNFQSFQVSCIADATNLSTHAGQTALITFVSLVARMGVQIHLEVPEVKLIGLQPSLKKQFLLEGLLDLGNDLIPGSSITSKISSSPDMGFVFGDTPYDSNQTPAWCISGGEWDGKLSQPRFVGNRWTAEWPIGAMTAAALGAAEVYKGIICRIGVTQQQSLFFEPVRQAAWDWGSDCPIDLNLDCGSVDLVSAGAIGQAAMYVLLEVPGLKMFPRIFDDDVVDGTTLNRGMLTRSSDIGQRKVDVIARKIESQAVPVRLGRDALLRYAPMSPSILVGVDDIPSRWEVQRATMGWLGVGGTSHYGTISSSHEPGEPCAGCLHWIDDSENLQILPTVSFVSFWAGLALAVRFLRHRLEHPYPRNKQSLWLVPLRMDDANAGWWTPVSPRDDCPVGCGVSNISNIRTATANVVTI